MSMDTLIELSRLWTQSNLPEEVKTNLPGLIAKYKSLGKAERRRFLSQVEGSLKEQLSRLRSKLSPDVAGGGENYWPVSRGLLSMLFVAVVLVFFGYKLYKSLSERERKREEKKKNKQLKKKK